MLCTLSLARTTSLTMKSSGADLGANEKSVTPTGIATIAVIWNAALVRCLPAFFPPSVPSLDLVTRNPLTQIHQMAAV